MMLGKLFLTGIFVVLPVILEAQHNRDHYPSRWLSSTNNKHPKDSKIITSASFYNPDNVENAADESHKRKELESDIVFPGEGILLARNDDDSAGNEVGFVPICKEKHFCQGEPHYPTDLINRMLRENPSLKSYATVDAVEFISHRLDPGYDELCESRIEPVIPTSGTTIADDRVFIVQSNELNFTQTIRAEVCQMEDSVCHVIEGLITGYKTICKQKYIYRQLMSLSHKGEVVPDLFKIPASCCCHLVREDV